MLRRYAFVDHTRISKIQATLSKQYYLCQPHRFPGAIAEEKIWREVDRVLSSEKLADELIREAQKSLASSDKRQEETRVKTKIHSINTQVDALTGRLGELPPEVSAAPIYKQMQKFGLLKKEWESRLEELRKQNSEIEKVVDLETYSDFLAFLNSLKEGGIRPEVRQKVIERLIHRVELLPDAIKIHFVVGGVKIKRELEIFSSLEKTSDFSLVGGSTKLTSGGSCPGTSEPCPPVVTLTFGERWIRKKVDIAELVNLRSSGLSHREIAARLSIGKTSVVRALQKAGS